MERRGFLRRVSLAAAAVAGTLAGISFIRQFTMKKPGAGKRFRIGRAGDFPVDTYTYVDELKVYVYRDHESIRAVSAVCTHLGCTVQRTTEGFECPCHGSCYSDSGEVLSGPAPTALSWYTMERDPDGQIVVDMNLKAEQGEGFRII